MTGDAVRQVFETILPQEEIDRLCQECGVIERRRKLNLGCWVPVYASDIGRDTGWRLGGGASCARIWSLRCPAWRVPPSIGGR